MTEEERAELHRQQAANRAAWAAAREQALRGDESAATSVRAAWQPRLDAFLPQPSEPLPEDIEPVPVPPRVPGWVELPERYRRS